MINENRGFSPFLLDNQRACVMIIIGVEKMLTQFIDLLEYDVSLGAPCTKYPTCKKQKGIKLSSELLSLLFQRNLLKFTLIFG